ncbi:hypothetical protein SLAV_28495 [Streptomyces lavendulae subsp. lavendulae]|uniref:Uncharacterized protein n=1 Tax=Streptomyces lavendulae subsp. lavendulae TaxID=58340 RepID=A0A2K8PL77_STRLA|nr:DUF1015 domain-containing protein [Streptomyces lavendulae]ATZ27486.1 hypothetical protein SLAV_28495 [Streptomyces lavendulae subsp. lavendulae]QUQ57313.1 hypothetical protein SLLC_26640 [Streptomyces lavendulae subsp. lavendulae]GLW02951.1 hypothetical protein Slala05_65810 [Streptomyces lavendulae subsp. lavendulae]
MTTPGNAEHGLRLIPFHGLRYVPQRVGSLAAVTSPPYDVVVRPDGVDYLESADPHNIVRLILPQAETPAARNEQAARTLRDWLAEGILSADPQPALYVYEQRRAGVLQRGIIGALALSEAGDGIVLPHEDVMPDVVTDRAGLMRATSANLEPLLLTYLGDGPGTGAAAVVEATAARRPPLLSTVTEDGFCHSLWAITDPAELAAVTDDLGHRQALIADGHHRWATYLRLQQEHGSPTPWDFGLVLLVDTARYPLQVRAIHRMLRRLPLSRALAALDGSFRVRPVDGPLPLALEALADASERGNAFLLTGDGTFHLVTDPDPALIERTVRHDRPEAWRRLDATVLHATLLDALWQVPDAPDQITYIHDAPATVAMAERHGGTAVLLHPVREAVVRDLARQGVTMPRKSTSFGPKPATGLVLRSVD